MAVLVLNSINKDVDYYKRIKDVVTEELELSGSGKLVNVEESNIGNCVGCFGCWIKTPGECVLQDEGNIIAKEVIEAKKVILITEISFGSYSSITKKVIDRLMPNVTPLFKLINKETQYKKRYENYPEMVVIAVSDEDEPEKELFKNIVSKKNAVNFNSKETKVKFISPNSIYLENELFKFLKEEI
ncbi:hypothetical protein SAMN02745163_02799 [Clostridium cavendishii DSM 21758]|uniref:Uncharacterized protein n=1 Tax=Clostridium cavendishii DSM 21758 TaxID=1121302 RepID=A0A1M6MXV1_9CLOT|nr:NAD(P)H-dependent oxidoreductase [Clostridium cavendishii]SHJ88163.1 hypothetical protein SAMN02745163_02799 [Clostridium cavendishii DSM 21758]